MEAGERGTDLKIGGKSEKETDRDEEKCRKKSFRQFRE